MRISADSRDRVLGNCLKEELPIGMSSGARRGPGGLAVSEQAKQDEWTGGGRRQRRPVRSFALL